jgi:hypothetical protein
MQDVAGSMKKEIHRMELRKSDLDRSKEQLVKELERAIEKRGTITLKGRAALANSRKQGGRLTETQLQKKCDELRRSVLDTEAESSATDGRITALLRRRVLLAEQLENVAVSCRELREREGALSVEVQALVATKTARLLQTQRVITVAGILEDAVAGVDGAAASLPEEQGLDAYQGALEREQAAIKGVIAQLVEAHADVAPMLQRTLLHAEAMAVMG